MCKYFSKWSILKSNKVYDWTCEECRPITIDLQKEIEQLGVECNQPILIKSLFLSIDLQVNGVWTFGTSKTCKKRNIFSGRSAEFTSSKEDEAGLNDIKPVSLRLFLAYKVRLI